MQVWLLGQEDPLEEEMTTHSGILAWESPWTKDPGGLQSLGLQELDRIDQLCMHINVYLDHIYIHTSIYISHARSPCLSSTPGIYSNSCPLGQWCHPTMSSSVVPFSSCLQSFPASGSFQMSHSFTSGGPKHWSFSFNISPFNEHLRLIFFRVDWLDLPAVQGTLKNLPQYHSSKASVLQHSAFFIVQLSHPYMTTGKTIALTRWTFFWQSNVSAF